MSLLRSALCRRHHTITPQTLRFLERSRVFRAGHRGRRRSPELVRRTQNERKALAPSGAQSERVQTDRILTPSPRQIARDVFGADVKFGMLRAVVDSKGEDRGGGL